MPCLQRKGYMTIYNGVISDITYEDAQDPIAISGNTNTSSSIRIRFTADDDSVVLAWGGHIASRLDWGFSTTTGKALSAAGISGSPYHMRQISMNICGSPNLSGFGQQDRSLSATAVIIPPPECPIVAQPNKMLDATSFTFTIDSPEAGATYTWSFGTNTAGAAFSGGVNTGNSVTDRAFRQRLYGWFIYTEHTSFEKWSHNPGMPGRSNGYSYTGDSHCICQSNDD